jgi:hypothetical protein
MGKFLWERKYKQENKAEKTVKNLEENGKKAS